MVKTNKEQMLEIIEILNDSGEDSFGHVNLGVNLRVYVDQDNYEAKEPIDWYFSINFKGITFEAFGLRDNDFYEGIDLTELFDDLKAELEIYLKPKTKMFTLSNGKKVSEETVIECLKSLVE